MRRRKEINHLKTMNPNTAIKVDSEDELKQLLNGFVNKKAYRENAFYKFYNSGDSYLYCAKEGALLIVNDLPFNDTKVVPNPFKIDSEKDKEMQVKLDKSIYELCKSADELGLKAIVTFELKQD